MNPYGIDLRPFLPVKWAVELRSASDFAARVSREGGGPGSLSVDNAGLDYRVLTRDPLLEQVPWLDKIHRETLPALLALRAHESPIPIEAAHGVNLNVLSPDSVLSGLEWHLDGADVAGVVVLSPDPWNEDRGGRFLAHDGLGVVPFDIEPGIGLAVATGDWPHAVEAPRISQRITVMFAYTSPERQEREAGTDRYLFSN